jgi:alpha/beta superfamily hydrolase
MERTPCEIGEFEGQEMTFSSARVERAVRFPSAGQPSFILEGILHEPRRTEPEQKAPVVILCHPHPVSSDMHDPLISSLAINLAENGMLALRFNFRGVGKSAGQQTDGNMEPLDLAGAIHFALAQPGVNHAKVAVIGHAFGANIALTYAPYDRRIRTIVAVSLLLYRIPPNNQKLFDGPLLFITGEDDQVCPLYKLQPFVEQQKGRKGIKVITGARHLMRGYENVAVATIMKYMQTWATESGV